MSLSKENISEWLNRATAENTHMLVVRDGFSYEYYPVFVKLGEDVQAKIKEHSNNMESVLEVYNLQLNLDKQIEATVTWNP